MTSLDALLDAVKTKDADAVAALLNAEPSLVQARPDDGASPVLMAAYVGADEVFGRASCAWGTTQPLGGRGPRRYNAASGMAGQRSKPHKHLQRRRLDPRFIWQASSGTVLSPSAS